MFNIFENSITRKVEKLKRLQGQVEVLKKEQKVSQDSVLKEYDVKQADLSNNTNAEIASLKAQIKSLEDHKKAQAELLDEQRKVALDKTINDYNAKITNVMNKVTKLTHLIEAEKKTQEDVVNPSAVRGTTATTGYAIPNTTTDTSTKVNKPRSTKPVNNKKSKSIGFDITK